MKLKTYQRPTKLHPLTKQERIHLMLAMLFKTGWIRASFKGSKAAAAGVYSEPAHWFCKFLSRSFTVEENEEDARVGELLSAQQVDVLHAEVEGQFDDGPVLHVCGDVCHQSQVLDQTAGLPNHRSKQKGEKLTFVK